jgi:hypothetical protein
MCAYRAANGAFGLFFTKFVMASTSIGVQSSGLPSPGFRPRFLPRFVFSSSSNASASCSSSSSCSSTSSSCCFLFCCSCFFASRFTAAIADIAVTVAVPSSKKTRRIGARPPGRRPPPAFFVFRALGAMALILQSARFDPERPEFWEQAYERLFLRKYSTRRFRASFGGSPSCCAAAFATLRRKGAAPASPEHLLWALHFLKQYPILENACISFGVSEPTYRSVVARILDAIVEHLQLVLTLVCVSLAAALNASVCGKD